MCHMYNNGSLSLPLATPADSRGYPLERACVGMIMSDCVLLRAAERPAWYFFSTPLRQSSALGVSPLDSNLSSPVSFMSSSSCGFSS